jgi:hypothetical protein
MASAYKAVLTVLFPYRLIDNRYTGEITALKATLEQDARERFMTLKNRVSVPEALACEFLPEIGFIADRINAFLKRNKVQALVISQRQANVMNEISTKTLEHLISSSKLPFTIVPEEIDAEVLSE